jgi:hypothetical protein
MSKPGRNDGCPCGSGKKFKKCCEGKTPDKRNGRFLMVVVFGLLGAAVVAGVASFDSDRSTGVRIWDPAHGHYHNASGTQVP